jgi:alpha-amylase
VALNKEVERLQAKLEKAEGKKAPAVKKEPAPRNRRRPRKQRQRSRLPRKLLRRKKNNRNII